MPLIIELFRLIPCKLLPGIIGFLIACIIEFLICWLNKNFDDFSINIIRALYSSPIIAYYINRLIKINRGDKKRKIIKKVRLRIWPLLLLILISSFFLIKSFDFTKPLYIYWYKTTGKIVYLNIDENSIPDNENVEIQQKKHKVILTSQKEIKNYWMKFFINKDLENWKSFKRLYLNVNYNKGTYFRNRKLMLKIEINSISLRPSNTKNYINIQDYGRYSIYLLQTKGNILYKIDSTYFINNNEICITLDKGKLNNFNIELALIP